jgi:phage protein D
MLEADYKVLADGQDITAKIRDRLLSLTVHDASGLESDTLTLVLDNRDLAIAFPATGAALQVWIGYKQQPLTFKGVYQVDELEDTLDTDELTIHAKAARMKGSLKAPKDASYDDISFGDLVAQIAGEHGYDSAINDELAPVMFTHIDQKGESDLNLLSRLAKEHNAIAKPVNDKLVVIPKSLAKSVSGQPLPALTISDRANSSGRVSIHERTDYQAVTAYWFDEANQQRVAVTQGEGQPVYVMRDNFTDKDKASSAAKGKLEDLRRGKSSLTLTRPLTPAMMPEGVITLTKHKPSANGAWIVEEVDHVIGGGGVSSTSARCVTKE